MKVSKTVTTQYILEEPNKRVSPILVSGWIKKLDKVGIDLDNASFRIEEDTYGYSRGVIEIVKKTYYDDSTLNRMEK